MQIENMTYEDILCEAVKRLSAAGVSEADTDAWLLFSDSFAISRSEYFFKKKDHISPDRAQCLDILFDRLREREKRIPVQYILGSQEFYGLTFKVTPDVLIPRLDTEVLVEEILKEGVAGRRVLDLCTGSGCIIETIAHEGKPEFCVGTDLSEAALSVAMENAALNGVDVKLLQGDLYEALDCLDDKTFDIIVSNPPYIADREKCDLMPEVLDHEPHMALFAPDDGLEFYKRILRDACKYLRENGTIWFEIGCEQGEALKRIAAENGYFEVVIIKDLAGLDRVVKIRR